MRLPHSAMVLLRAYGSSTAIATTNNGAACITAAASTADQWQANSSGCTEQQLASSNIGAKRGLGRCHSAASPKLGAAEREIRIAVIL